MRTSIGLGVGYKESVDLSAHRADGIGELVIGDHVAEIRLERVHLETLRDQIPGVLAELGVLEAAEERAAKAGGRAAELVTFLKDQAESADEAGEHERTGELRGMADKLTGAVEALGTALSAVQEAAGAADEVSEDAKRLLDERVAEQRAAPDQPTEELRANGHPVDLA